MTPDAQLAPSASPAPAARRRYLYIFCYQTPQQRAVPAPDHAEESSQAVFIEADSAEQALAWGREIAEDFVRKLFRDPSASWEQHGFAHWIEADPKGEYPAETLSRLPVVAAGAYPVFDPPSGRG